MLIESSNIEHGTLESVVKSDSSVEQRVYFVRELKSRSQGSIKGRSFKGSIGLRGDSMVYFVQGRIVGRGVPHRLIKGIIGL